MIPRYLIFLIAAIEFGFGLTPVVAVQTTNAIPQNLFLTDDGSVFWYKPKQRLVAVEKIKAAQGSPESRPASDDPDGHWGAITNGLQLSLRFNKRSFTNGEPIVATVLIRNVTNAPVKFFRFHISHQPSPINIQVFKSGKMILLKKDGGFKEASGTEVDIYPQTQLKFNVKINDYYDLATVGEFLVQAVYDQDDEVESQKVPIEIQ